MSFQHMGDAPNNRRSDLSWRNLTRSDLTWRFPFMTKGWPQPVKKTREYVFKYPNYVSQLKSDSYCRPKIIPSKKSFMWTSSVCNMQPKRKRKMAQEIWTRRAEAIPIAPIRWDGWYYSSRDNWQQVVRIELFRKEARTPLPCSCFPPCDFVHGSISQFKITEQLTIFEILQPKCSIPLYKQQSGPALQNQNHSLL